MRKHLLKPVNRVEQGAKMLCRTLSEGQQKHSTGKAADPSASLGMAKGKVVLPLTSVAQSASFLL
jgi:hypothetical protein